MCTDSASQWGKNAKWRGKMKKTRDHSERGNEAKKNIKPIVKRALIVCSDNERRKKRRRTPSHSTRLPYLKRRAWNSTNGRGTKQNLFSFREDFSCLSVSRHLKISSFLLLSLVSVFVVWLGHIFTELPGDRIVFPMPFQTRVWLWVGNPIHARMGRKGRAS